jgi:hypothetical protein
MIKIYFRVTFNMVMKHSKADGDKLSLKATDLTNANEITKEGEALPCKLCLSSVNLVGEAKVPSH